MKFLKFLGIQPRQGGRFKFLPSAPQIEHEEVELNFFHHEDLDKDLWQGSTDQKLRKSLDQVGPVGPQIWRSVDPWSLIFTPCG